MGFCQQFFPLQLMTTMRFGFFLNSLLQVTVQGCVKPKWKASFENEWIGLPLKKGHCWNPPSGTFALTSFFQQGRLFILVQPRDTSGPLRTIVTLSDWLAGQNWGSVRPTPNIGGLGVRIQMETYYVFKYYKVINQASKSLYFLSSYLDKNNNIER